MRRKGNKESKKGKALYKGRASEEREEVRKRGESEEKGRHWVKSEKVERKGGREDEGKTKRKR